MGKHVTGDTFDQVYEKVVGQVMRDPDFTCSPRGQRVRESIAFSFTLNDPRARLLTNEARATNYGFGVGEFLWYWQGRNDLETMLYYNRRMKDFSNDEVTLNSAYGYRMLSETVDDGWGHTPLTQWQVCVRELLTDPDSRRALIHINRPDDQFTATVGYGSKDVPCTLSLQFFVRDGRLELHAHMRSNDVVWGLTYDLFSFTLFQECMLLELRKHERFRDLRLGRYHHTAGSLHIYERHFEQAERMLMEYRTVLDRPSGTMEPIPSLEGLAELCVLEHELRVTGAAAASRLDYGGGLAWMADVLREHRRKRDAGR